MQGFGGAAPETRGVVGGVGQHPPDIKSEGLPAQNKAPTKIL